MIKILNCPQTSTRMLVHVDGSCAVEDTPELWAGTAADPYQIASDLVMAGGETWSAVLGLRPGSWFLTAGSRVAVPQSPAATEMLAPRLVQAGAASVDANWLLPENLLNGGEATVNWDENGDSGWLTASDWDFELPAGATITGLEVRVNLRSDHVGFTVAGVQLALDGVRSGNTRLAASAVAEDAIEVLRSGGAGDLWGLTPETVSSLGVALKLTGTTGAHAAVQAVVLRVYYQPADVYQLQVHDQVSTRVVASKPTPSLVNTGLDQRGQLFGLEREVGESLSDYRQWLLDYWRHPQGMTPVGQLSMVSRALRLQRKPAMLVLSATQDVDLRVKAGKLTWTSPSKIVTEVALVAQNSFVRVNHGIHQVLRCQRFSGVEVAWELTSEGLAIAEARGEQVEVVYQPVYAQNLLESGLTLKGLMLRVNAACAHAGFSESGRVGTCALAKPTTGWPDRLISEAKDVWRPCANGACSGYAAATSPRFVVATSWQRDRGFAGGEDLLDLPAFTLVGNGLPIAWARADSHLWLAQLEVCPAALLPLIDPEVRASLAADGYTGSALERAGSELEQAMANLWDRAVPGDVVVSPDASAQSGSLWPLEVKPDKLNHKLFSSGIAASQPASLRVLDPSGTDWRFGVNPGYFWRGPLLHYIYGDKQCVSLSDCAVLEIDHSKVVWGNTQGQRMATPGCIGYGDAFQTIDGLEGLFDPSPQAFAVAADGSVFVSGPTGNPNEYKMWRLDPEGPTEIDNRSLPILYIAPLSKTHVIYCTVDRDGNSYGVYKWLSGTPSLLNGAPGPLFDARVTRENEVYIVSGPPPKVYKYTGTTLSLTASLPDEATVIPYKINLDDRGTLWVLCEDGEVYSIDPAAPSTMTRYAFDTYASRVWTSISRTSRGVFATVRGGVKDPDPSLWVMRLEHDLPVLTLTLDAVANNSVLTLEGPWGTSEEFIFKAVPLSLDDIENDPTPANVKRALEHRLGDWIEVALLATGVVIRPRVDANWSVLSARCTSAALLIESATADCWLYQQRYDGTTWANQTGNDGPAWLSMNIASPQRLLDDVWSGVGDYDSWAVFGSGSHVYLTEALTDTAGLGLVRRIDGPEIQLRDTEVLRRCRLAILDGQTEVVIPSNLIQNVPGVTRVFLGPVLAQNPGLWQRLRNTTQLVVDFIETEDNQLAEHLSLELGQCRLRWRLPEVPQGDAPVVITNNAVAYDDDVRLKYFPIEEFDVDDLGWLTFSRGETLLYNSSFEQLDANDIPVDWQLERANLSDLKWVRLASAILGGHDLTAHHVGPVNTRQWRGCAWRGETAIMMRFADVTSKPIVYSLTTRVDVDPRQRYCLSLVARKGQRTSDRVIADLGDITLTLAVLCTPVDSQGTELAWPSDFDGQAGTGADAFDGWTSPLVLTDDWQRFAIPLGLRERRWPAEAAGVVIRVIAMPQPAAECVALIDSVQLERGSLATDFADRAYGLGDDLTIEYERNAEGFWESPVVSDPANLPDQPVLALAPLRTHAQLYGRVTALVLNQLTGSQIDGLHLVQDAVIDDTFLFSVDPGQDEAWFSVYNPDGGAGYFARGQFTIDDDGASADVDYEVGFHIGTDNPDVNATYAFGVRCAYGTWSWFLTWAGVRYSQATESTLGADIRFEIDGQDLVGYLSDVEAVRWTLDSAMPAGGVQLRGRLTPFADGSGLTLSEAGYSVSDTQPEVVELNDWTPWYDRDLAVQSNPALRLNRTLHRASVPYAVLTGHNKLRHTRWWDTTDSESETLVLTGTSPLTPAILEVSPTTRSLRYRRPGERVRLVFTAKSEAGWRVSGAQIDLTLDSRSLGKISLPGGSPASSLRVTTDADGNAAVDYLVPERLDYKYLQIGSTDNQVLTLTLKDVNKNAASSDFRLSNPDGLHNRGLLIMSAYDSGDSRMEPVATGASLLTATGVALEDLTHLTGAVVDLDWDDVGADTHEQDDRLTGLTLNYAMVNRSVRLKINNVEQFLVADAGECYSRPGSYYVAYDENSTSIVFHTVESPSQFKLEGVRRWLLTTDTNGDPLPDNQVRVMASAVGLPACWLALEPNGLDLLSAELVGAGRTPESLKSLQFVHVLPPSARDELNQPVRMLDIAFSAPPIVGGASTPGGIPGSGDSLRVVLQWSPPRDTTGVTEYLFAWSAVGPYGGYNEKYNPQTVIMRGSNTEPYVTGLSLATSVTNGDAVAYDPAGNRVMVKSPGHTTLDTPSLSVLTPEAGGLAVSEGGGVDRAMYTATVLTIDDSGEIVGMASVSRRSPDLTPPEPPVVYPHGSDNLPVTLRSTPVILRPDDSDTGRILSRLCAPGALAIEYLEGSLRFDTQRMAWYSATCKIEILLGSQKIKPGVPLLPVILGVSDSWPYFTSRRRAARASRGQRVVIPTGGHALTFKITPVVAGPASGNLSLRFTAALPWIEQPGDLENVTVRWQEQAYTQRNLKTGLLEPSFNKELPL